MARGKRRLPLLILIAAAVAISTVHADDKKKDRRSHTQEIRREHRESHNYIIERQQIGAVQGVPTSRIINGKREIDVYPNGLMFEKNNVVGVKDR